jgi:hypothetical protein
VAVHHDAGAGGPRPEEPGPETRDVTQHAHFATVTSVAWIVCKMSLSRERAREHWRIALIHNSAYQSIVDLCSAAGVTDTIVVVTMEGDEREHGCLTSLTSSGYVS